VLVGITTERNPDRYCHHYGAMLNAA